MRRFVSLFVIAALLAVSSVPLASTVACAMPDSSVASGDHGQHAMSMSMAKSMDVHDMHAGHDHSMKLSGDWQSCRIECGCGCHRSIDSLPHLLAPHSADSGFQPVVVTVERVEPVITSVPDARLLFGTSPPPDFI